MRVVTTLLRECERVKMEAPAMFVSKLWMKKLTRLKYSSPEMARMPLVSVPASVARTTSSWLATLVAALVFMDTIFNWLISRLAAASLASSAVAVKLPPK